MGQPAVGSYKRKKERKHALYPESDQENDQEKKKDFEFKNINQFHFQPLE